METYSVASGVEVCEELAVYEVLDVVDHEEHDGLGHQVSARLGDNFHVRVDEVADGLNLSLELRIHGTHRCIGTLKFVGLMG